MMNRERGKWAGFRDKFLREKVAFMVKNIGILAFRGKDPGGS
jgi:hypothetical protein